MEFKSIRVRRGKKVNIGDGESEELDLSVEAELGEFDDVRDAINDLNRFLTDQIESWEREVRNGGSRGGQLLPDTTSTETPRVLTADTMLSELEVPQKSSQASPPAQTTQTQKETPVSPTREPERRQPLAETKVLMQNLDYRSNTIGGAGGIGYYVVLVTVILLVIDAENNGKVLILGRGRNYDLLNTTPPVSHRIGSIPEDTG